MINLEIPDPFDTFVSNKYKDFIINELNLNFTNLFMNFDFKLKHSNDLSLNFYKF